MYHLPVFPNRADSHRRIRCLLYTSVADGESVAVIGVTGMNLASGTGGERSYGTLSAMTSPYAALQESLGEEKVTGVAYNDTIGTPVPAENFYTTIDGEEHGATRTYGVAAVEGTETVLQGFAGGGGFGSASLEDTLMEGHELGELCQIDENINFTTGTINGAPNKTCLLYTSTSQIHFEIHHNTLDLEFTNTCFPIPIKS